MRSKFCNLLGVNLLSPLGMIYGRMMDVRNGLYDRGVLRSHSLGARTISIGNLTAGGTGKTPLVALTAKILADSGEKVCVLTRGYGRANENERVLVSGGQSVLANAAVGGDEPVELARKLIGKAVVVADADRVRAAKWAKDRFGATVFILDDAFQHRRAKRDLDIVCIDATDPFGGGVIPAGTARERIEGLRRADAIVITRADLVPDISDLRSQISEHAPDAPIFNAQNVITGLVPLDEFLSGPRRDPVDTAEADQAMNLDATWRKLRAEARPDDPDAEVRLLAFCALGNPHGFFLLLNRKFDEEAMDEFSLRVIKPFPDHHVYAQRDIESLDSRAAAGAKIDAFLTTAKDAVKLEGLKFEIPCYVVEIESRIHDEAAFREMIISS